MQHRIRVFVRSYPPYDRALGGRNSEIELPDGSSIRDLIQLVNITECFADLSEVRTSEDMYRSVMPQRDDRLLELDDRLADGDRITLFPPVSGG